MKELFAIGPIHIYFFGLMIAIGVIIGGVFSTKIAEKIGIDEDTIFKLIFVILISGIIGARLFFIIFYDPVFYLNNPGEILKINEGGLSIHGGIFIAIISGYLYTVKKKLSFFKLADVMILGIVLAQGIGRVGCDVFGKPMNSIMMWGINYNNEILHPAQVYEFILDYILFGFLLRRSYKKKFDGEIFAIYVIAFPIIRGFVEFFRINPIIVNRFSISHLLSLILIVIGIVIYILGSKKSKNLDMIVMEENITLKNTILIVISMIVISLCIFYFVQG